MLCAIWLSGHGIAGLSLLIPLFVAGISLPVFLISFAVVRRFLEATDAAGIIMLTFVAVINIIVGIFLLFMITDYFSGGDAQYRVTNACSGTLLDVLFNFGIICTPLAVLLLGAYAMGCVIKARQRW